MPHQAMTPSISQRISRNAIAVSLLSTLAFSTLAALGIFFHSSTGAQIRGTGSEGEHVSLVDERPRRRRMQGYDGEDTEKAAIATLITNIDSDVEQLCQALQTLIFLHGDQLERPRSPVLIFHEDLSFEQKSGLMSCTDRTIRFHEVRFEKFPSNFDRFKEESTSTKVPFVKGEGGRSTWGYHQMIRWWTTGIWRHPAIEPYDSIMRFDADMCFFRGNAYLPHLATPGKVYHSYFGGAEPEPQYVEGLYDFAVNYMKEHEIIPANPEMWDIVEKVVEKKQSLPLFQTSVEVSRKSFMQRSDVDSWHSSLTEREPFGVYRHRWSDGVTRFLTMAMFATPGSVQVEREQQYFDLYHNNCARGDFDEVLAGNQFKRYALNFLGLSLFKERGGKI